MINNKIHLIIFMFLILFYRVDAFSQTNIQVKRIDKNAYEVTCEMNFPDNVCSKLLDFSWSMKNVTHLLSDQPVNVSYEGNELGQFVSYRYNIMFMHNFTRYVRTKSPTIGKINFKLIESECSIPFIPKTQSAYGEYAFTSDNKTTTMHFFQKFVLSGSMSDLYFDRVKKGFIQFFKKFETDATIYLNESKD